MSKLLQPSNLKATSSELEQLARSCADWRKTKSNKFDPMPSDLQKLIAQLIKSGRYSNYKIMQAAKINKAKINELAVKNFGNNPELIPFTLVDKSDTQANPAITSTKTCKTTNEYLTINSANGDSISIPLNLSESAMQNIIKLFLCCK